MSEATNRWYTDWGGHGPIHYASIPGVIGVLADPADPETRVGEAHPWSWTEEAEGAEVLFRLCIEGRFLEGLYVCREREFVCLKESEPPA
jgi:hypothetical protein